MDILTISGILLAIVAIAGGQYLDGGEVHTLLNSTAFIIVIGGTTGAVMLQTPVNIFRKAINMIPWVFRPPKLHIGTNINKVIAWSLQARKKGLLGLEESARKEKDRFARKGLEILIDGGNADMLRKIMNVEIDTQEQDGLRASRVFESMGGYSPTIGIIGAVLGLIHVLGNLEDPTKLGAGIAVAFVATIYGIGLANLLFLPIASKLKSIIYEQSRYREMILEGLISISEGENPKLIESKLRGFVTEL